MAVAEPFIEMPADRLPRDAAGGRPAPRATQTMPRTVLAILTFGLALRLVVVAWLAWHGQTLYVADERDYGALAVSLVERGEFAFSPGDLTSIRPPLYPTMVAGIYAVAGERNYTAVRLIQAFIGTLTAWIVYILGRNLYGERVGTIAAAVCAFYPSLVATAGLLLTETLFTFCLCTSCLVMQQCLARGEAWRFASLGAVLALGALTRSVLWLFPPVMLVFLLVCDWRQTIPRRLLHASIAVAAFALVLAPWAYRNTRLQKTFTAVDVMGGRNFMMGNYEYTPLDRPWDAISVGGQRSWDAVLRANVPAARGVTQGQLDKLALKYGLNYIKEHPGQSLLRETAKFFHFWQLERELVAGLMEGFWGGLRKPAILVIAAIILGSYVLVVLSAIVGWSLRWPEQTSMHLFLLLVAAFVCGIHTLVFAHSRYHLPLMPLLGIYAAAAWAGDGSLWQPRRAAFWLAGGVCLVLALSWCRELATELARFS